jgi:hypothetical protein
MINDNFVVYKYLTSCTSAKLRNNIISFTIKWLEGYVYIRQHIKKYGMVWYSHLKLCEVLIAWYLSYSLSITCKMV